jgi:hypothetical protein
MAIHHLTTKLVKRIRGMQCDRGGCYRSGSALYEEATGITHDCSRKMGVAHSEFRPPENAPAWVFDRQKRWNTVESVEIRTDARVAREIEIGLPIQLLKNERINWLRDFVQREFVSKRLVADFAFHLDKPNNPHPHILLITRELTHEGFG